MGKVLLSNEAEARVTAARSVAGPGGLFRPTPRSEQSEPEGARGGHQAGPLGGLLYTQGPLGVRCVDGLNIAFQHTGTHKPRQRNAAMLNRLYWKLELWIGTTQVTN